MPRFDKGGVCEKCNRRVVRMKKGGTWHHVDIEDYKKCGFVKIKDDKPSIARKVTEMESVIYKLDQTMLKSEFPLTLRDKILEDIFKHYGYDEKTDTYNHGGTK